jgi:hypothetical protein
MSWVVIAGPSSKIPKKKPGESAGEFRERLKQWQGAPAVVPKAPAPVGLPTWPDHRSPPGPQYEGPGPGNRRKDKSRPLLQTLLHRGYDTVEWDSGVSTHDVCLALGGQRWTLNQFLQGLAHDAPLFERSHPGDKMCSVIVYCDGRDDVPVVRVDSWGLAGGDAEDVTPEDEAVLDLVQKTDQETLSWLKSLTDEELMVLEIDPSAFRRVTGPMTQPQVEQVPPGEEFLVGTSGLKQ